MEKRPEMPGIRSTEGQEGAVGDNAEPASLGCPREARRYRKERQWDAAMFWVLEFE